MLKKIIKVPNCFNLNQSNQSVEEFINLVLASQNEYPLVYNMEQVAFLHPYGVSILLYTARWIAQRSGYPVTLTNMDSKVYAYLDRVDLFRQGASWVRTDQVLSEKLTRRPDSDNLLELTCLNSAAAHARFVNRARLIMTTWLNDDAVEIDQLFTVLSEVCSNARDHSKDEGHVMIQKFRRTTTSPPVIEVHIVVCDLGIGIRGSLEATYGSIAATPIEYIKLALQGRSARGERQGGAGLQKIITNRIKQKGGVLSIRSNTGLALIQNDKEDSYEVFENFPGTQVSLVLRSLYDLSEPK